MLASRPLVRRERRPITQTLWEWHMKSTANQIPHETGFIPYSYTDRKIYPAWSPPTSHSLLVTNAWPRGRNSARLVNANKCFYSLHKGLSFILFIQFMKIEMLQILHLYSPPILLKNFVFIKEIDENTMYYIRLIKKFDTYFGPIQENNRRR